MPTVYFYRQGNCHHKLRPKPSFHFDSSEHTRFIVNYCRACVGIYTCLNIYMNIYMIFGRHCSGNIFFQNTAVVSYLCFGLNCAWVEMAEAKTKYFAVFVSIFNLVYS